jgi:endo-1,4-beta-D-glucanase Y
MLGLRAVSTGGSDGDAGSAEALRFSAGSWRKQRDKERGANVASRLLRVG